MGRHARISIAQGLRYMRYRLALVMDGVIAKDRLNLGNHIII